MGFTNQEISILTNGGWSKSTIKQYTGGTRVVDLSTKYEAIKMLAGLIDNGYTLKDVEEVISIINELENKGLKLDDVTELLAEAKQLKLKVKEILQIFKQVRDTGLKVNVLREALGYISRLESEGLTIDFLKKVYEAGEKLGGYTRVVEAIEAYGKLEMIKSEINRLEEEKAELEKTIDNLEKMVRKLEKRREELAHILNNYNKLVKMGYDDKALHELSKATEKYGGLKGVLEAINTYKDLSSLNKEVSETMMMKKN